MAVTLGHRSAGERAEEVVKLLNLAMDAVRPSDIIGSHSKGDVLRLLERLKAEEAMRILDGESK